MLIHLNSKHFFKYDKLNEFMYNKVPPTICFQVAYFCNASKLCTVNEINEYLYGKKLEVYLLIFAPQTQDHQKMKAGFDSTAIIPTQNWNGTHQFARNWNVFGTLCSIESELCMEYYGNQWGREDATEALM